MDFMEPASRRLDKGSHMKKRGHSYRILRKLQAALYFFWMLYIGPYGDLYQTHVNTLFLIFLLLLPFPRIHLHFYPTLLSFLQGAQLGSRHTRFWNCDSMSSWSNPGGRGVGSRGSRKTVALGPSDSWEWYRQGKHIFLLLILTISYGIPLSIIMASIFLSPCSALPETHLQPDEVKYEVGEEG